MKPIRHVKRKNMKKLAWVLSALFAPASSWVVAETNRQERWALDEVQCHNDAKFAEICSKLCYLPTDKGPLPIVCGDRNYSDEIKRQWYQLVRDPSEHRYTQRGKMIDWNRTENRSQAPSNTEKPADAPAGAADQKLTQPFRITFDEELVDGKGRTAQDKQRLSDIRLEKGEVQVRYDGLETRQALNVWGTPFAPVQGQTLSFYSYSNYVHWLAKAEVRVFVRDAVTGSLSAQQTPLAVVPIEPTGGLAKWLPPATLKVGDEVHFLLRVYGKDGKFDETAMRAFRLTDRPRPIEGVEAPEREALIGYGQDSLELRNVAVTGGAITVNGAGLRPGSRVQALGIEVPVDAQGKFVLRQLMPAGNHMACRVNTPVVWVCVAKICFTSWWATLLRVKIQCQVVLRKWGLMGLFTPITPPCCNKTAPTTTAISMSMDGLLFISSVALTTTRF
jgi:hypothetical protein